MSLVPEKGSVGEKVGNISHMIQFICFLLNIIQLNLQMAKKERTAEY